VVCVCRSVHEKVGSKIGVHEFLGERERERRLELVSSIDITTREKRNVRRRIRAYTITQRLE
jgi:hypothetical protein